MERGTVSMRVAFVLRSVEVQPLFRDLLVACILLQRIMPRNLSPPIQNFLKSPKTQEVELLKKAVF
jgi:hypothetical protein